MMDNYIYNINKNTPLYIRETSHKMYNMNKKIRI